MGDIKDFQCTYDNSAGINEEVTRELELQFPDAYMHHETMAIDAKYVFKAMRKKPELMKEVFWKLGGEILRFMEEAKKYGVDMISYADSSGGLNILGPKMAEQVVEDFTYEFLKKAAEKLGDSPLILLCPKTTFALLGTGKAEFVDAELSGPMEYGEGCIEMIGKARFMGQMCIKNVHYKLESGRIKTVRLI